ncbi:MAG: hypothetical protein AB8G11_10940 [Saprospiraceae bacterium]
MYNKIDKLFGQIGRYHTNQSLPELQYHLTIIIEELEAIKVPQKYLRLKATKIKKCICLQKKLTMNLIGNEQYLVSSELLEQLTKTYLWLFDVNEK